MSWFFYVSACATGVRYLVGKLCKRHKCGREHFGAEGVAFDKCKINRLYIRISCLKTLERPARTTLEC